MTADLTDEDLANLRKELAHGAFGRFGAIISKLHDEHARLREEESRVTDRLQALCDEAGCPAGLNRFDFIAGQLRQLTTLRAVVVELLKSFEKLRNDIAPDLVSAHQARVDAASQWMREEDRDLRNEFERVCYAAAALRAKLEEEPTP